MRYLFLNELELSIYEEIFDNLTGLGKLAAAGFATAAVADDAMPMKQSHFMATSANGTAIRLWPTGHGMATDTRTRCHG